MLCMCMHACVCGSVSAPHPSKTHSETVPFPNSNSQKTSHKKGTLFKWWELLWSHICSLHWIVSGTLTCKYILNPALSESEQTFHSCLKQYGRSWRSNPYKTDTTNTVTKTLKTAKWDICQLNRTTIRVMSLSPQIIFLIILTFCMKWSHFKTLQPSNIEPKWSLYQASPTLDFDIEINKS